MSGSSGRPRGFLPSWKPQARTEAVLKQVKQVLLEYVSYLPLTCRQVFYRLVGAHGYEKTEQAYERLCEATLLHGSVRVASRSRAA
jgi:hypothetical protein